MTDEPVQPDEQPVQLLSLPVIEAEQWFKAAKRDDPEATAFFAELWPEPGPCFVCGAPLAAFEGGTALLPDPPNAKRGVLMLGRECDRCLALPTQVRMHKLTVMFKKMWPGFRPTRPAWNRPR